MKMPLVAVFATLLLVLPLDANETPAHAGASEAAATGEPAPESPLTDAERALKLDPRAVKLDEHGEAYLLWEKEPVRVDLILDLTPWDLMKIYQSLTAKALPLSRFGQGGIDELTQAWRDKLAEFVVSRQDPAVEHQENLFDPELVLWDPGYIQNQNEWGQWYLHLDRRDIVQRDLATLSPLEVQQAVVVLTGRTYPVEFVLEHLEAFRAQLTVHQRLAEAVASETPPAHE
ncbi:MAG: hypothetical protein WCG80_14335 [Spirochaetales bacterium]